MDNHVDEPGLLPPGTPVVLQILFGAITTGAVIGAAELGVADVLAERPHDLPELAEATGADPGSLRRLLRVLIGLGIVRSDGDGRYALDSR